MPKWQRVVYSFFQNLLPMTQMLTFCQCVRGCGESQLGLTLMACAIELGNGLRASPSAGADEWPLSVESAAKSGHPSNRL
jgi:hypothetical protein